MMSANDELMAIMKVVQEKIYPIQNEGLYAVPILIFNQRYYDDLRTRITQEMEGIKMGNPMKLNEVFGYEVIFDPNVKTYKVVFDIQ